MNDLLYMGFRVVNFGCRLNIYEGEMIKQVLRDASSYQDEDIVIFNSCVVTKEAERQLLQAVRKEKRENPDVIIGVVGCAVQVNKEKYLNLPYVDFVLGNLDKLDLSNYTRIQKDKSSLCQVSDIFKPRDIKSNIVYGLEGKVRAFVQIQSGCNNECTFCLTRLARGPSISIEPQDIINQIQVLLDNGYKEIVLTGVNISDYGSSLQKKIKLSGLIKLILQETKLDRLRLSSLDIADFDEELIDLVSNEARLMPHLHFSLQSGDNTILARMKRRHTREDAFNICNEVLKRRSEVVFGADFIAGFPTETADMHANSCGLIRDLPITYGHIFPYSERPETPAAKMPQLDLFIRRQRAKELRDLADYNLRLLRQRCIGSNQNVLVESKNIVRLENYLRWEIRDNLDDKIGQIINMKLDRL